MEITTVKITTGLFDVYADGVKTDYQIINGSAGLSGRDTPNIYGVCYPGKKTVWSGTIARCKKTVALTLKKQTEEISK